MLILFYFLCGMWVIQEIFLAIRDRGHIPKKKDPTSIILQVYLVLGVNISIFFSFFPYLHIFENTERVLGSASFLMLLGISIRMWAVFTLGKYFRRVILIQENHTLITHGPYKYIRHPSYTGSFLSFLGFGIACNNWLSVAAICICVGFAFMLRIKEEEKVLLHAFGKGYTDYMLRTKRLIPFIY